MTRFPTSPLSIFLPTECTAAPGSNNSNKGDEAKQGSKSKSKGDEAKRGSNNSKGDEAKQGSNSNSKGTGKASRVPPRMPRRQYRNARAWKEYADRQAAKANAVSTLQLAQFSFSS